MKRRYQSEVELRSELASFLQSRRDLLTSDRDEWTQGECLNLAVALSVELGRPARPWVVVCESPSGSQHECHAYVKLQDGTCLDGNGVQSEESMMEESRLWHEDHGVVGTTQHVEPLQRWHTRTMDVDKRVVRNIRQALFERFGAR